jgi:hypothetical protein
MGLRIDPDSRNDANAELPDGHNQNYSRLQLLASADTALTRSVPGELLDRATRPFFGVI